MTNPKLTLYIDIVSPFAYLAYYVTRVRFDENPNDKTIVCVSLSMSLDYFCCEFFSFPILREGRKKNLSVELCELSQCLAALASSLDF
jgi:hypothetical protein